MRWKYIVPRAVVLAALWGFFAFGFDPLLKHEVVVEGQSAVTAKVDVATIQTSFFPPAISVTGVRVANHGKPGTNLVEFELARNESAQRGAGRRNRWSSKKA